MRSRGAQRGLARLKRKPVRRPADPGVVAVSALPASLFECQEPMVEAALMDAAARVFLERLGGSADQGQPAEPTAQVRREQVPASAVAACLAELATLADDPVPDLLRGLDHERLWILFDLARYGTGLGRQRATHELRTLVRALCERPDDAPELLGALATELGRALASGGFPVVFQALHLEIKSCSTRRELAATAPAAGSSG